jgi:hypothetical protein
MGMGKSAFIIFFICFLSLEVFGVNIFIPDNWGCSPESGYSSNERGDIRMPANYLSDLRAAGYTVTRNDVYGGWLVTVPDDYVLTRYRAPDEPCAFEGADRRNCSEDRFFPGGARRVFTNGSQPYGGDMCGGPSNGRPLDTDTAANLRKKFPYLYVDPIIINNNEFGGINENGKWVAPIVASDKPPRNCNVMREAEGWFPNDGIHDYYAVSDGYFSWLSNSKPGTAAKTAAGMGVRMTVDGADEALEVWSFLRFLGGGSAREGARLLVTQVGLQGVTKCVPHAAAFGGGLALGTVVNGAGFNPFSPIANSAYGVGAHSASIESPGVSPGITISGLNSTIISGPVVPERPATLPLR